MDIRAISVRIDDTLLKKLQYIAASEERSVNGQIVTLVKQMIRAYEHEHGEIPLE